MKRLAARGKMELLTFWKLKEMAGSSRMERVTIFNNKTKAEETLPMDCVIPQPGFISSLGAIAEWGLEIVKGDINVPQTMNTNTPGIYAACDITTYSGNIKNILTVVAVARIAVTLIG